MIEEHDLEVDHTALKADLLLSIGLKYNWFTTYLQRDIISFIHDFGIGGLGIFLEENLS